MINAMTEAPLIKKNIVHSMRDRTQEKNRLNKIEREMKIFSCINSIDFGPTLRHYCIHLVS